MAEQTLKAKIATLNVRGLKDKTKRYALFQWAQEKSIDILCLQETFWTQDLLNTCKQEWNGACYLSVTDSSHSRGVAILISKKFSHSLIDVHNSEDGRKILININHLGITLSIACCYAPNNCKDRISFLKKCQNWISRFALDFDNLILAGDFNSILDARDRVSGKMESCKPHFQKLINMLSLNDGWRSHNLDSNEYSYINKASCKSNSRIDYIFVSDFLNSCIKKAVMSPAPVPDHKCVLLSIDSCKRSRGKGYWKLNVSIIKEENYQNIVKALINDTRHHYEQCLSSKKFFDFLKIRIKESSIKYCISRNRLIKDEITDIEREINNIDKILVNCSEQNDINAFCIKRNELQGKLDHYYIDKAEGARIRSKSKWMEDGERNTKFFHRLEKQRQNFNRIDSVLNTDNKPVFNDEKILDVTKDFYQTLYTSKNIVHDDIQTYINETNISKTLNDVEKRECEGLITINECKNAIALMGSNKSPGLDGIPTEFYKEFWGDLGDCLINSFNESFKDKELSDSQKCSVLSLIYKKGDKQNLKNYRPISLTNTDYRILAFTLSLRLQKVISKIVGPNQTGYIRGRFIGTNIRLIEDVIEYCNRFNKKGVVLFLDFEKAFDSVEWPFMIETLKAFNFGSDFIHWIETLYCDPKAVIKNNGWLSGNISISRGIRQGCAISALLFILVVEILALRIDDSKNIKGISLKVSDTEKELRLSQYADDLALMLADEEYITTSLKLIQDFSEVAGPKLNLKKTEGLWLGTYKHRQTNCDIAGINWPSDPIRCLGIFVGHNKKKCFELNWQNKIDNIEICSEKWSLRNLTLLGKVHLIKSELISKIVFTASILPIPEGVIKKINKILFKFLWGNSEKIQRQIIVNDILDGGLNMVDIEAQFQALKAAWVPRFTRDNVLNCSWTYIPSYYLNLFGTDNSILKMNVSDVRLLPELKKIPLFWQEVITGFNKAKNIQNPVSRNDILESIVWGNRVFTYKKRNTSLVLHNLEWSKCGLIKVKDFKFTNGKVDQHYIIEKIRNRSCIFQDMKCFLLAVKPYCSVIQHHTPFTNSSWKDISVLYDSDKEIDITNLRSKYFYKKLMDLKMIKPYVENVWSLDYSDKNIDFSKSYLKRVKLIKDLKLAQFNFKIFHKILPNERILNRWKIMDTSNCIFCGTPSSDIHLLFECSRIKPLWLILFKSGYFGNIPFEPKNLFFYTYFQNEIKKVKVFSLTLLCYSIYAEWLDSKANHIKRTVQQRIRFIVNRLKYKKQIYFHIKWCDVANEIQNLVNFLK